MRNLLASTNGRITPLDLEGSDFDLGFHERLFKTYPGFPPHVAPAEELSVVLSMRQAQILLQRLKTRTDYQQFAEDTFCHD